MDMTNRRSFLTGITSLTALAACGGVPMPSTRSPAGAAIPDDLRPVAGW